MVLFAFFIHSTEGQYSTSSKHNFTFTHLSVQQDLADNTVEAALLDRQGYLWFATQNGLSRFNGQHFQNFGSIPTDTTTLAGIAVMDMVEDRAGKIWVAVLGGAGLHRFDSTTETFRRFYLPKEKSYHDQAAKCLLQDEADENLIWIGTYNSGLLRFNKTTETFVRFELEKGLSATNDVFKKNSVNHLLQDRTNENYLWLAANNGIFRLDKTTEQLEHFPFVWKGKKMDSHAALFLLAQGQDEIWVGSWALGLAKFEIENQRWTYFFTNEEARKKGNEFANVINQIEVRSEDELWICSQSEGLSIFNIAEEEFSFVKHNPSISESIFSNKINGMYQDAEGRQWFFNEKKGVSLLDPANQQFEYIALPSEVECKNVESGAITDFAWDEINKKLYVVEASCDNLYVLDQARNYVSHTALTRSSPNAIDYFLLLDSKNQLWIAGEGLWKYDEISKTCKPPFDNSILNNNTFTGIIEGQNGTIWLGTKKQGLLRLTSETGEVKQYLQSEKNPNAPPSHEVLNDLMEDSNGNIWISGQHQGVYKFSPDQETFTIFPKSLNGLPEQHTWTLEEDEDGKIWVGCQSRGIRLIDPAGATDQEMLQHEIGGELKSEQVVRIEKDLEGDLWVSTRNSLNKFDFSKKRFTSFDGSYAMQALFQNPFTSRKGLKVLSDGRLLVGGNHGFYVGRPKNFTKNHTPPKVVLTELKIFDEVQEFEKSLNFLDKIILKHDQNFFSIGFAALNFTHGEQHSISYQLEGFNKDWVKLEDNNIANFTNVGAGTYALRAKALNNDGVWSGVNERVELTIQVLPPWYQTWLAYLAYLLMIGGGIWTYIYFQKKRWQLQAELQLEEAKAKRLQELDEFKTRLNTNITHEFRTPLTVILGITDQLGELKNNSKIPSKEKGQLVKGFDLIERNGNKLLRLINQLLDLSKLDAKNLKPNYEPREVVSLIQYLGESFESLATQKGVRLSVYSEVDELNMLVDEMKLQQIIFNLLSNAIKFTPENGKVILHLAQIENELQLKIKDTGEGIAEATLPHIFDRFYQVDNPMSRKGEGTGIGLALVKELVELMDGTITVKSELGKGTAFKVLLPIQEVGDFIPTLTKLSAVDLSKKRTDKIGLNEAIDLEEAYGSVSKVVEDSQPYLLLVEDNPDVVFYIQSLLEPFYNIIIANDGQAGIDQALEHIPDLIISDVMMPKKDGFELVATLKQDERTSHIPIILLTAKATKQDKLEGLKFGADAYLMKPFDKEELFVRLENLLEVRRGLQVKYSSGANLEIVQPPPLPQSLEDVFLGKVNSILEKNYTDSSFKIQDLAQALDLNYHQFNRKLKALTNQTPTHFIRSFRLQKGKILLQAENDLNVSEVAYGVGFESANYFSRAFSEEFGKSPNEVKK